MLCVHAYERKSLLPARMNTKHTCANPAHAVRALRFLKVSRAPAAKFHDILHHLSLDDHNSERLSL